MRRFWTLPLRHQLFLAIVLLLVPVVVYTVWAGNMARDERTEELAEQAAFIASTTAAYVNRDIANLDGMVQRVSTDPAVAARDAAAVRDLLSRVLASRASLVRMVLVDGAGAEVARADRAPHLADVDGWLAAVRGARGRIILPIDSEASPQHTILAYPIRAGADLVGAIGVYVALDSLNDAFSSLPLPDGSVITIADLSGRILARSAAGEGAEADRVYREASIDAGPWTVSVGLPAAIASEQTASLWTRSFSILALGVAGWLVVALVLSSRLTRAVTHLDTTAQRIAAGDFSPMVHKPMVSREFVKLQTAFDWMLTRLNDTRRALDSQMAEERRIRQELESLQGQVIRQERLAAVGQLVSGVAHEINNPLQAILGFSELLQMQADVPETIKSDLRLIQKESARACGIIRNLALFARQTPGEAAPVRLADVIASVAELRQRRLESEDIELQVDDQSGQHVMAVLTELQQVVLNFVVNAEQAIVNSGRLPGRITVRTFDRGGTVVLEVEDTGPGVPPEHEAKLFQPFFTTKPVGQGTGLGLSVSYGIIDSMHGTIGYRRSAGGSVFYFELPAAS